MGIGSLGDPKVLLALAGLAISSVLVIKKVPGSLLIGIVAATLIGLFVTDPVTGNPITGFHPGTYGIFDKMPSLAPVALHLDLTGALKLSLAVPIFSLLFVDFFDTIGGFVGIASRAGMIDERGNLKNGSRALIADSCGTVIGALLGTSNTTTYARECRRSQCGRQDRHDGSRGGIVLFHGAVPIALVYQRTFRGDCACADHRGDPHVLIPGRDRLDRRFQGDPVHPDDHKKRE